MEATEPSNMTSPGVSGDSFLLFSSKLCFFVFERVSERNSDSTHNFLVCLFPASLLIHGPCKTMNSKQLGLGGGGSFFDVSKCLR